ncbi:VanZ family protein [Thermodesulfobacteriota bacterium]
MKIYLRFIPMVGIMGIIFYLSHQPGDFIRLPLFPGIDKLAHCIAYGCLAGAFLYGLQPYFNTFNNKFIVTIIVVALCVLFGISDEYHQSFIPGRFVSFWDVVADGLGAILVVGWWLLKTRPKNSKDYSLYDK